MSLLASLESEVCKTLAALVPSAIVVIGPEGSIRFASPAAAHMFGWEPAEFTGLPVTSLVPERQRDAYTPFDPQRVSKSYQHAHAEQLDMFGLRQDGEEFPVEIAHQVLDAPDGRYLVVVVTDVSRTQELETLERANRKLQRAAELGTLSAGIANEFGNTMLALGGYTAMARAVLGDTPQQDLKRAEGAATHALELVDRLLGFLHGRERERRPVDLAAVVSEAAHLLRPSLPENVRLQLALESTAPTVVADDSAILRLVVNLMMNSVQAMPTGGLLRVNVQRFTPDADWMERHGKQDFGVFVQLEFADSGLGMEPEVLRRAFACAFSTRPDGLGLGLPSVRRVVDALGGTVDVRAIPGQGTRVAITLPAKNTVQG